jgi:toxin ParE1/3/4
VTPYTIHAEAEGELRAALDRYEDIRAGLGGEFRREFEAALARVRQNPLLYAVDDETGTRLYPFHRFPYNLVYLDLGDHVWIAAVAHQHRRPNYWVRRQPG